MKYVGAHVSATGGVSKAPINAHEINAKAFALFVKNQRRWDAKPLEKAEIEAKKEFPEDEIEVWEIKVQGFKIKCEIEEA